MYPRDGNDNLNLARIRSLPVGPSWIRRCSLVELSILLSISCSLSVFAQSQFDVWTTDQGLPQNSIQAILQTRDGYLWLATFDGLVRFDGAQFTVFNSGNSPGLRSNRITALFEDQAGVLWIGTADGGLESYRDGIFSNYNVKDGLPSNLVQQIEADPVSAGKLLVTTSEGVIRWPGKELFQRSPHENVPTSRLKYTTRDGSIWFSDGFTLYRIKDGVERTYTHRDGLLSASITSIYQDHVGSVWIGTKFDGVQRLRDGAFRNFATKEGLPKSHVNIFYEDRQGDLWLGTHDDGLVRLRYSNDDEHWDAAPPKERVRSYTTAQGLSSNAITSIYEDVEGSLWIGTAANGVNRLRQQIIQTYSQQNGLSGDNIYPVYQDRAGNIWMGIWPHGLMLYRDGAFSSYTKREGLTAGDYVTAVAEDREGYLWVGGYDGVCWFDGGKFKPFHEKLPTRGGGINAIYQDSSGGFWFGTDVAGLYRYQDGALTHMTTQDGLPNDSVHAILEDTEGNVWLGTYGGLVRFRDDKLTVFSTQDGLASDRVRALYLDGEGVLWIGTFDGGLSRYKDGHFNSYTMRDGLFNSGVFQILEDSHGYLWLSCNLGIYRVSKRELNDFAAGKIHAIDSIAFGKSDGMLNQECNGGTQPAGIRARDGKLWFPTQTGVAIVDPEAIPLNSHPPPVLIESAIVDREIKDLREPIRIEPGEANLEIHYTGLSFIKPEHMKFKYKLEGADQDWVEAGNRRVAYYSHLASGDYVFHVIAANADGEWNTVGQQIKVMVVPPLWRRWWFVALAIITIALLGLMAHRRRVARLQRARDAQEAFSRRLIESQENERKRIAAELHDSLGQSLIIIKNQALLSLSTPDDHDKVIENMAEISASASEALGEVREIAYNLRPYQLDRIGLTKAIQGILEKVSSSSKIEFSADIDSIDGVLPKEAEINVYRIVQESLNNIVKHSEAARAEIEIRKNARSIHIMIHDNGKGFIRDDGESSPRRGLGLMGISERAGMLGAKHQILSSPGKGTTLTIQLRLKEQDEQ